MAVKAIPLILEEHTLSIYEAIKDAGKLAKEYQQMELYERLLDARKELADIREENLKLNQQNKELMDKLNTEQNLIFERGVYWIKADTKTSNNQDTPICPRCWDAERMLIRLSPKKYHMEGYGIYCPNCKTLSTIE